MITKAKAKRKVKHYLYIAARFPHSKQHNRDMAAAYMVLWAAL
jgi:hypothetical protein